MSTFVDLVRNGKLKGPQQRGFTIAAWKKGFEDVLSSDECDRNLFQAGIWISFEFDKVREISSAALPVVKDLSQSTRIRVLTGYANLQWSTLSQAATRALNKDKGSGKAQFPMALETLVVQRPFRKTVDLNASVEVLVDGLRFPMTFCLNLDPLSDLKRSSTNPISDFLHLVNAGQYYHALEQIWLDCVWNSQVIQETESSVIIQYPNDELSRRERVSQFRRMALAAEVTQFSISMYEGQKVTPGLRYQKRVSLNKRNRKFSIEVVDAACFADDHSSMPLVQLIQLPDYADSILYKKLSEYHDLTLMEISRAYHALSQIALQAGNLNKQREAIFTLEGFAPFAPIFKSSELINAFCKVAEISQPQSDCLLELMTHSSKLKDQYWFKPLIKISEDEFTIVLPSVIGINFPRLFDSLIQSTEELKYELGHLFENHVFERLSDSFSSSPIKKCLGLVKAPGLIVDVEGEKEEIDLAFFIGPKLFLCELKSSQFPSEPLEHHGYKESLNKAAEQIARKVTFVSNNLKTALDQLGLYQTSKLEEIKIFPLIVSSSALYAGWLWKDIPVCDLHILDRFFDNPQLELLGSFSKGGTKSYTSSERFYRSLEEAVERAEAYFGHAPQVAVYEQYLKQDVIALPRFSENETIKVIKTYAVRPPYEEFQETMRNKEFKED